jgi:hypothetical protein
MKRKFTRVVSFALALSGSLYVFLGWRIPTFWPGFLIYAGWISIAFGYTKVDRPWFWWISVSWHALWLAFLLAVAPISSVSDMSFIQWHPRLHLLFATLLSALAAIKTARHLKMP